VTRLRTALARLDAAAARHPDAGAPVPPQVEVVRRAARSLPAAAWRPDGGPGRPACVVHGDWHLGQLGRSRGGDRGWLLVDVDDLGIGDPVWDLGRPAAFWAAGLMPDGDWGAFVGAYRAGGGPALPPEPVDPWPVLDVVARAGVVLAAAGAVRRALPDGRFAEGADARIVEVCGRLAPLGPPSAGLP
jgi:aminoglycoside phosphotransferase (APT) family kinase protein